MRLTPDGQLVMILAEKNNWAAVSLGDGRVITCKSKDLQDAPDVGPFGFHESHNGLKETLQELGRLMMFEKQAD